LNTSDIFEIFKVLFGLCLKNGHRTYYISFNGICQALFFKKLKKVRTAFVQAGGTHLSEVAITGSFLHKNPPCTNAP